MKAIGKICVALVVLAGVVFAQSHLIVYHAFKAPAMTGDFPWNMWDINKMANPNDYLNQNSVNCYTLDYGDTLIVYADIGNYPSHGWLNGDTACMLGSYEVDPDGSTHEAWYWLFSDTATTALYLEYWEPYDTMRVMEPADVNASRRTLNVDIPNPYETARPPWGSEEYDVLGFWVVADTTGSGLVANYDVDLGFVAVDGGPGETTTFTYDTDTQYYPGFAKSLYHSYYIVARPETTTTSGVIPGFSTLHMAGNSNLYTFGVEESGSAEYVIPTLAAAPNPFTQSATISYSVAQSSPVKLTLYNTAGQLIQTLLNETKPAGKHSIQFDGASLPSGVYFYRLETAERSITNTFTKVK